MCKKSSRFWDRRNLEDIYLKVEKLVIGNTYYIPHGTWNYKKGVLIRILDDKKKVLLQGKGEKLFYCSINKLHTVPYKAVAGYKARERIKQQMKEMEKRKQEKEKITKKDKE